MTPSQPADSLPLGSFDDTRAGRGTRRVAWTWNGKRYEAQVKPLSWGVEKRAIRECTDGPSIDMGDYVEFMLANLVDDCNTPLKGPELAAQDPDLVWAAAREIGILAHLKKLGIKMLTDPDRVRLSTQDIIREYLVVEHRLREKGYALAEIESMSADDVATLFQITEADRSEAHDRQALMLAQIVSARLGV